MDIKDYIKYVLPYGLMHKRDAEKLKVEREMQEEKRKEEIAIAAEKKKQAKINKFLNTKGSTSWASKYSNFSHTEGIEASWVLYEAHGGTGMICNPLALFKAFMLRDDFNDYTHIWVIKDTSEIELLRAEYAKYRNVIFVYYRSKAYSYYLAKCKYLINNTSFLGPFAKREGQVYLNTWHSITVKSLGFDTPDGREIIKNMLRNFLASDYISSPNEFMRNIYDDSFRLRNIYAGKYIEEGYPRNDLVINTDKDYIISKLRERGTIVDPDKKIILYAPTWSGNDANNPIIDMSKYTNLYEHLSKTINMDEYQLLVKPHHVVYRNLTPSEMESGRYVSYGIDANELLSIVDILITDYSSIYFDYTIADKPILFYIPDYEEYSKIRGIYFKLEELPGPCSFDLQNLSDNINNIDKVIKDYEPIRHETMAWANKYDDGNVSSRTLEVVFGKSSKSLRVLEPKSEGKKSLLFYIGALKTNGVTSAAASLFNRIDYSKYDVTLFVLSTQDEVKNNLDAINENVRVIVRCDIQRRTGELLRVYNDSLEKAFAIDEEDREIQEHIFWREYSRCFGDTKFDYIIDFSGYGAYFPLTTLYGDKEKRAKHFIWQHNDIVLDIGNEEKKALSGNVVTIEALSNIYTYCDKVVSATKAVYDINYKKMATEGTKDKFTYVTNTMDENRISTLLAKEQAVDIDGYMLADAYTSLSGVIETKLIPFDKKAVNFVTMGRCMPEKNHRNIIKAIKMLADEGVDAHLFIIGDGQLKEELENLAEKLGISNRIVVTGVLKNPFTLLKNCNCFVFPSIYEAQGLAVLEARLAKLPIVISNYEAVSSVLIDDKQFILKGTEAEDILEGMHAYLNGEIKTDYVFDLDSYNEKAMAEFYKLLEE